MAAKKFSKKLKIRRLSNEDLLNHPDANFTVREEDPSGFSIVRVVVSTPSEKGSGFFIQQPDGKILPKDYDLFRAQDALYNFSFWGGPRRSKTRIEEDRDRVYDILKKSKLGMTISEVSAGLGGAPESTVRSDLEALIKEGLALKFVNTEEQTGLFGRHQKGLSKKVAVYHSR